MACHLDPLRSHPLPPRASQLPPAPNYLASPAPTSRLLASLPRSHPGQSGHLIMKCHAVHFVGPVNLQVNVNSRAQLLSRLSRLVSRRISVQVPERPTPPHSPHFPLRHAPPRRHSPPRTSPPRASQSHTPYVAPRLPSTPRARAFALPRTCLVDPSHLAPPHPPAIHTSPSSVHRTTALSSSTSSSPHSRRPHAISSTRRLPPSRRRPACPPRSRRSRFDETRIASPLGWRISRALTKPERRTWVPLI